jgi:hypothetical protein
MLKLLLWFLVLQSNTIVSPAVPQAPTHPDASGFFERTNSVAFHLDGAWPRFAASADGAYLYYLDGTTLRSISLHSGGQETLTDAEVWGSNANLSAIPGDPARLLVTWQCGDARSSFAVGVLDLKSGSVLALPVTEEPAGASTGSEPPASGVGGRNAAGARGFASCNGDGRLFVSRSGHHALFATSTSFPCPAARYAIVSLATGAVEHQITAPAPPTPLGSHEGSPTAAGPAGCPEETDFAWSQGELLYVYYGSTRPTMSSYVLQRVEGSKWEVVTSGVDQVEHPTNALVRSRTAWHAHVPLRILRYTASEPVEIDAQPYFAGLPASGDLSHSWVEAVTGLREVVLLRAQPRSGGGYEVAAVTLRWKDPKP